jgi:peptide/nickel transport system ATP-binding protein
MTAVALAAARTMSPSDRPLLGVRALNVSFRSAGAWRDVVSDLSFDLAPKETLAIVGESGSGKSVTALAIMGLLPKAYARYSGTIRLQDRDLLTCTREEMRAVRGNRIAMIFQEPMTSLNPVFTVGFQIREALKYHRGLEGAAARQRAVELLERVRIPNATERLESYPHTLSGGMRQRVMIAMALACEPQLLIADEPTTALDVTVQQQILDLIRTLQHEMGMAVLFITHDMGVVAEIADRVLVMRHGVSQEEGRTAALFVAPRSLYARELLAAVPRIGSMRGAAQPRKASELSSSACDPAPRAALADDTILEVENLTTRFPIGAGLLRRGRMVHAVENVSFTLQRGETLALVGESGCGKSTTGRSIIRLVEPTGGVVRFEDEDVLTADRSALRRLRRDIQMIFQDPYASLNPRKLVGSAIAEPMRVHGVHAPEDIDEAVAELLSRVGLPRDAADRFPHEFSGGQRQRICIARALGLSPKLIIADEAVSALDVSIKSQVIDLMIDLQRALGLSYLFISHDIAVVERISHRVAVMYRGEIVEIGPRDAVINAPQHPYTQRLMAAVPTPDPATRTRSVPALIAEAPGTVHDARCGPPRTKLIGVGPDHFVRVGEHDESFIQRPLSPIPS